MSAPTRGYMPVSKRHDWATPSSLFDALDAEFGPFDLDPCGSREHHHSAYKIHARGGRFYDGTTPLLDGLTQPWKAEAVFLNPPYGRAMTRWIGKAVHEVELGNAKRVVALIPARTDTKMWQRFIMREAGFRTDGRQVIDGHHACRLVRFLPGRVRFAHSDGPAPFPSAIVVWEA